MSTSKERGSGRTRPGPANKPTPSPPPPAPQSNRARWRERWEKFKTKYLRLPKVPGWLAVVIALVSWIPDWKSRLEFWATQIQRIGEGLAVMAIVLSSPLFNLALLTAGIAYLIFVGEPAKTLKSRVWTYVGWAMIGLLGLSVFSIAEAGYVAANLSPIRNVTKHQHDVIKTEALRMAPYLIAEGGVPHFLTVMSVDTPEADSYTSQIMDSFRDGGIGSQSLAPGMSSPFPMRVLSMNIRGIFIQVGDVNKPPPGAAMLKSILSDAGLVSKYTTSASQGSSGYVLTVGLP